ncbi:Protein-glutamate methylesterase/protein-glutamine glutaminase [Streptomyces tanashiensis]
MTIRVLVADDQELVRSGFAMILDAQPDIEVVAEAGDGAEAVEAVRRLAPDVALLDIRMPRTDGIEACRAISAESGCRTVMLTTFDTDAYVYEALHAGASGFLLKDVRRDDLVHAVRVVAAGDSLLAPSVARRLVEQYTAGGPRRTDPRLDVLTGRERETLLLLARGLSNAEIAAELVVSDHTVKTHVGNVLAKLGLRDRIQAVICAYETGLVAAGSPPPGGGAGPGLPRAGEEVTGRRPPVRAIRGSPQVSRMEPSRTTAHTTGVDHEEVHPHPARRRPGCGRRGRPGAHPGLRGGAPAGRVAELSAAESGPERGHRRAPARRRDGRAGPGRRHRGFLAGQRGRPRPGDQRPGGSGRPLPGRFGDEGVQAATVLQLAAEGRIDLDRPARAYLPDLIPGRYARVTVRQLLNHTHGIPAADLPGETVEEWYENRFVVHTPEELVRSATARPREFRPGTKQHYLNIGYTIAGLIVERVTGDSYEHQVERRILRPLGLRDTYFPGADPEIAGPYNHGYQTMRLDDGTTGLRDVSVWGTTDGWAAGDLVSTTTDLERFTRVLFKGGVVRGPLLEEMFTIPKVPDLTSGDPAAYSAGLSMKRLGGREVWGKTGGRWGYNAAIASTRDGARTLVYSVNSTDAKGQQMNRTALGLMVAAYGLPD